MEQTVSKITYRRIILIIGGSLSKQTVNEDTCKQLPDPTFLKTGSLPLTALASFQGSGNTWVRQVLARATGKSMYNDNSQLGEM